MLLGVAVALLAHDHSPAVFHVLVDDGDPALPRISSHMRLFRRAVRPHRFVSAGFGLVPRRRMGGPDAASIVVEAL